MEEKNVDQLNNGRGSRFVLGYLIKVKLDISLCYLLPSPLKDKAYPKVEFNHMSLV